MLTTPKPSNMNPIVDTFLDEFYDAFLSTVLGDQDVDGRALHEGSRPVKAANIDRYRQDWAKGVHDD